MYYRGRYSPLFLLDNIDYFVENMEDMKDIEL